MYGAHARVNTILTFALKKTAYLVIIRGRHLLEIFPLFEEGRR